MDANLMVNTDANYGSVCKSSNSFGFFAGWQKFQTRDESGVTFFDFFNFLK